jgi:hypothetical protein
MVEQLDLINIYKVIHKQYNMYYFQVQVAQFPGTHYLLSLYQVSIYI